MAWYDTTVRQPEVTVELHAVPWALENTLGRYRYIHERKARYTNQRNTDTFWFRTCKDRHVIISPQNESISVVPEHPIVRRGRCVLKGGGGAGLTICIFFQ